MRSIVQVMLWSGPYLGNVMSSELALARAVRRRFGLGTHFVLAEGAAGQSWLADLEAAGATWSILPSEHSAWRPHLDRVVAEHRAALVHTQFTAADLQGAASAGKAGIPCVWHIRTGFDGYPLRQRAKDLVKMRIVARRRVAHIVTVSEWLGELTRRRGAPADRIAVLPDAIVTERFSRMPAAVDARARFGLAEDAFVVLALGWWPEVKGVDVLLDALSLLAPAHPSLQALLVGEQQTRDFVASRGPAQPPWLRMTGFVDDAAWLYAAADAFVSASRHEGQSSAIGEALACRLPVAMSEIPGTAIWAAAPGVRTFPSGDARALAAGLESVLAAPPAERTRLGERSRAWIDAQAGIESWCEQLCDTYAKLL